MIEDLLPGPMTGMASSTIYHAVALLLTNHLANAASLTTGRAHTIQEQPLDFYQGKLKITITETDINPDLNAGDEGSNFKAIWARKMLIVTIIEISQNHNNSNKTHAISKLLSRPHIQTQKNLLCRNLDRFPEYTPQGQPKAEAEVMCRL